VRRRRFPVVGDGGGIWSFVHLDDAARATLLALTKGKPGIYNITDDEPAPVSLWLPAFALALGAAAPLRVPPWVGRLMLGTAGVSMMTRIRGSSNGKAKRELAWSLLYPTWRFGFRRELVTIPHRRVATSRPHRSSPAHQGA
jgi:nucleoside-diphosphate-sugar epimerase